MAIFGKLDVVVSAEACSEPGRSGKLLPQSYIEVVQPSEHSIICDIFAEEGRRVKAGQVLMHMDATLPEADSKDIATGMLAIYKLGLF